MLGCEPSLLRVLVEASTEYAETFPFDKASFMANGSTRDSFERFTIIVPLQSSRRSAPIMFTFAPTPSVTVFIVTQIISDLLKSSSSDTIFTPDFGDRFQTVTFMSRHDSSRATAEPMLPYPKI